MATTKRAAAQRIEIPILVQRHEVAKPHSKIARKAASAVYTALGKLAVDDVSLNACLDAGATLLTAGRERLSKMPHVSLDTLTFELSVAADGEVGFAGTGVGIEVAAALQITLKVSP